MDRSQRQSSIRLAGTGDIGGYDGDLTARIWEYADRCSRLTKDVPYDVIHAHDWMTFPAGMVLATRSGKPLIVQVHATEFDRSGEHINPALYEVERRGMHAAVKVITVSHMTRKIIIKRYGVAPEKIRVIHNGIDIKSRKNRESRSQHQVKTVLFLGRITKQKGPEFFVDAAAQVLKKADNVNFIIAGWGDLAPRVVEQVAALGLGRKIRFAGFLRGKDVERAYKMADVYVLPSVSEPFGLTVLEAIQHGVPVILSKNAGVTEVLPTGVLKCDFWDTKEMANQVLAILSHPEMAENLRQQAYSEIQSLSWDKAARKCMDVYREAV